MRRFTPSKRASDSIAALTGTPAWRAAASAASAFMRLCSPMRSQRTVPCFAPSSRTSKESSGWIAPTLHVWPGAEALHRRPAPRASTRSSAASLAIHHEQPLGGHDAHQVVELRLDGGEVRERCRRGRTRGCASTAVRGRYQTNLERLSKKAVSYSSASITKKRRLGERAPRRRSCARTPPMRKPGSSPAASRIHASIEEVVLLPCVPATASTHLSGSTCSASHCGPGDVGQARGRGSPRSRACRASSRCRPRRGRRVYASSCAAS